MNSIVSQKKFGQKGTYVEAISGIDVAPWDLLGKKLEFQFVNSLVGHSKLG